VRVYRFVLRLSQDRSLAEDIVSDVFIDVWRQAGSFKGKSRASTWLLAMARHKALSALRAHADAQLDDNAAASLADPTDNAVTTMSKRDRSATIQKCLAQLSVLHREVLDLVYYHERSVDEVAEIVGAPGKHGENTHVLCPQTHGEPARRSRLSSALIAANRFAHRADRA
jgi:RNA polymerase sigma-70 factor (ECF subfamily)